MGHRSVRSVFCEGDEAGVGAWYFVTGLIVTWFLVCWQRDFPPVTDGLKPPFPPKRRAWRGKVVETTDFLAVRRAWSGSTAAVRGVQAAWSACVTDFLAVRRAWTTCAAAVRSIRRAWMPYTAAVWPDQARRSSRATAAEDVRRAWTTFATDF
jgi:hypothetical protein